MANFGVMKITNLGMNLYTKIQTGSLIQFTKIQSGDGVLPGGTNIEDLTVLISPKFDVSIESFQVDTENHTVRIKGTKTNDGLLEGNFSREIGLFAIDPDIGEILYAYANAGEYPDYIPPITTGPYSKTYVINAAIGNATNVTAIVPTDIYVTKESFDLFKSEIDTQVTDFVNETTQTLTTFEQSVNASLEGIETELDTKLNTEDVMLSSDQIAMLSGSDGDVTISAKTTIPRNVMYYDNLTIDASITLTCKTGVTIIHVKNTLTLNGTISANGCGGASGSYGISGGAGGGFILIFANKIIGTGSILANGNNGNAGSNPASSVNTQSAPNTSIFKQADSSVAISDELKIRGGYSGNFENVIFYSSIPTLSGQIVDTLCSFGKLPTAIDINAGGAGGGNGDTMNLTANYYRNCGGAVGGGSIIGAGGFSGSAEGGTSGLGKAASGGAGGGAGLIMIKTYEPIPSCNISAKGGNAGAPYRDTSEFKVGGSGGGAGGLVILISPSSSAIINVAGGSASSGLGGGTAGGNGDAGLAKLITF